MHARSTAATPAGFLGIEAGGTRTSACWMEASGTVSHPKIFGPANLRLLSDPQLLQHFRTVAAAFPKPIAVGIGMAGARTEPDRNRIRTAARRVWPQAHSLATHDLETALAAADTPPDRALILVLSGTGSCCYGRDLRGHPAQVGGWGHLLGDQGSAYAIALQALRQVVEHWDHTAHWSPLGRSLLEHLHLNEPNQLIGWIHAAAKGDVAALAPVVFRAAAHRDRIARHTVGLAAQTLAEAALACARRLTPHDSPPHFVLAGGVLLGQPAFARRVRRAILTQCPGSTFVLLATPGALGAARLARQSWQTIAHAQPSPPASRASPTRRRPAPTPTPTVIPDTAKLSPTEERNPRSTHLDQLDPESAVDLMLREDARIPAALRREKPHLIEALQLIHHALSSGGRLFYVGAGTSGRLGVLDASECPPTFRTPPEWVQGIIAGGTEAVFRAVEGAEDDAAAGRRAIGFRGVTARDVVVGIAASGRTPFVWGALAEARERRAPTVLVCFNPHLVFDPKQRPTVVIAPRIGPEILTGSTRLKAGTATKLILNLFTTLTMVRLGKVVSNLMVDLNPANAKLRERALRITRQLTGADHATALASLEHHRWIVKKAVESLGRQDRT